MNKNIFYKLNIKIPIDIDNWYFNSQNKIK